MFRSAILAVAVLACCSAVFATNYWVVFGELDDTQHGLGNYLMKINELGQIVMPPVQVITPKKAPFGALSSISDAGNNQLLLMTEMGTPTAFIPVTRVLVDRNTLKATSPMGTGVHVNAVTFPVSIRSTQNSLPKFFVTEVGDQNARAFGITDAGLLNGTKWRVDPRVSRGDIAQVGVAPDGRMAWAINVTAINQPAKIYTQTLNTSGLPSGNPAVSATAQFIFAADLSNPVSGSRRFLAYQAFATVPLGTYLQVLDLNGNKMGTATQISSAMGNFVQAVSVEPQGKFMLYENSNSTCSKGDSLDFQALDASGNPMGMPIQLISCQPNRLVLGPGILQE